MASDPDTLPPDLRAEYQQQRASWEHLRALTEAETVAPHLEACDQAGRELTAAEARALLLRH